MPAYRLDIASTGRAGCQASECKKAQVKIAKGELRQAVFVTINEHDGWKYRHWGCTTPDIFHKWQDICEGDMDLVDGYDALPEELQVKVKRAFEQGHVDDEDWKGDVECNRWTGKNTPMFLTAKQRAARDAANDDAPPKKGAKKRSRAKAQEDADEEDEKPVAKKARGKKASKATVDDDEAEAVSSPPAKKARKSKKVKAEENEDDEVEAKTAPKQKKGRKTKTSANYAEDDEEEQELVDKKPVKKATSKRKSSKKATVDDDE